MSKIINAEVGTKVVLTGIQVDDKIDRNIVLSQGSFSDTKIKFDFKDSEWNDESLVKKATFYVERLETTYSVNVDSEGYAILPSEMFKYTGCVLVGVCGYKEENSSLLVRLSPVPVRVKIDLGSYDENMIDGLNKEPVFTTKDIKAKVTMIEENLEKLENKVKSVNELLNNANNKANEFSENVANGITSFNTNASNKLKEYNDNTTSKIEEYNTNASNKIETFNSNVTTKTTTFNENATTKTTSFNTNATEKTTEYNTNATSKVNEFNNSVDSIKKDIADNTSRSKRIEKVLYDSGEAEGTFINVKDSTLAEMQEVRIKNIEKQEVTEKNKNYFTGRDLPSSTMRGVTFNFDNSIIKLNGTSESAGVVYNVSSTKIKLPIGSWTLSFKVKSGDFTLSQNDLAIYLKNKDNTNMAYFALTDINKNIKVKHFTLEEETEIFLYAYTNNLNVVLNDLEIEVQVELGDTMTDFEQFVPLAPTPEEKRKLKIIDKSFNLFTNNKNLFDLNKWLDVISNRGTVEIIDNSLKITSTNENNPDAFTESAMIISNNRVPENQRKYLFKVKSNTNYKILFDVDGDEKTTTSENSCYYCLVNKDYLSTKFKPFSTFTIPSKNNKTLIQTDENTEWIGIRFGCKELNKSNIYSNIRLLKEDSDESYEKHQESILPIPVPENEFVADLDEYLIKYNEEDKKPHLYLRKNIGRKILDGTENWETQWSADNNYAWRLEIPNIKIQESLSGDSFVKSNYYKSYTQDTLFSVYENGISNRATQSQVIIKNNSITTLNEFKNNLKEQYDKGTPVTLVYELSEPYEIDLGIRDMPLTFLNETNIFTDCELQTEIKINYYRNPQLTIKELQKNLSLADSKILTLEGDITTLKEQVSQLITSSVAATNEECINENTIEESELITNDISSE